MQESSNYWSRWWEARLRRRRFITGAASGSAGLAALTTIGCGDDDDDDGQPAGGATQAPSGSTAPAGATIAAGSSPATSPSAEAPKRGGVWRAILAGDPATLDPYTSTASGAAMAFNYVYNNLVRVKAGPGIDPALFQVEPDLIEGFTVSDDGLTYTVTLNQKAKWHPPVSRPIDADDILYSWERYNGRAPDGPAANPRAASLNAIFASIDKVDEKTVAFKLKAPRGDFLRAPSTTFDGWVMMPRESDKAFNPAQQMVGTGPWLFESYTPGTVLKLKRNPEWHFGPDVPYMDAVEINIIPEYATRLNQFLAGNLDETDLNGQDLARAKDAVKDVQIYVGESNLPASYITFDGRPSAANAPWRDPRVRKAISMSLDRSAMLDAAYNLKDIEALDIGAKRRFNNDVPSLESPYWLDPQGKFQHETSDPKMSAENLKSFEYNPADAKKLLEAAGFADGFKTQLHSTPSQYGQAFNILGELVQQYCGQIGVELELIQDDYNAVYVNKIAREGEFEGLAHIPRGSGPFSQFDIYYLPGGIRWNSRVDDKVLQDNVNKMLQERDQDKARLAILELQQYVNDKMYLVPMQLGASGVYWAYRGNIRNALEYQVTSFTFGSTTIPYYWKSA